MSAKRRRTPGAGQRRRRGREYRIRVRAERRLPIDYPKLSRALLEQAAINERARVDAATEPDAAAGDADEIETDNQSEEEVGDDSD
ncbi:hypothetical protein [Microbacterium lacticum]